MPASGGITFRTRRLQLWLGIEEQQKPKVYGLIFESARIGSLSYWLEIVFSAGIATFGLVLNSPAVIIGAMLISPLMSPIMATGMALTVGDLYLAIRAVGNLLASVTASVGLAALLVWMLPFHAVTSEILARTNPNLLDLAVAIFSGLAGSVVVCRGAGTGSALPGVAIAVALMPPLCTMGFGIGSGGNFEIVGGAGLLFLTNLVAIVSSAFLVFFLVGMNSPLVAAEMRNARGNDRFAQWLSNGPPDRFFGDGGRVRWRILILVVILGSIAVPLRRALLQVASETVARAAVQTAVAKLSPADTLVSQQVEIGREAIAIRLVSTRNIPKQEIAAAEQSIGRRTRHKVNLSVQEVASRTELAALVTRLTAPAPAQPTPEPEKSLDEIRQEILANVTPDVTSAWPRAAPLVAFDLAFNPGGLILNVRYQAERDLDDISIGLIARDLEARLKVSAITLNAVRTPLPSRARKR